MSNIGNKFALRSDLTFDNLFSVIPGDDLIPAARAQAPVAALTPADAAARKRRRKAQGTAIRMLVTIISRCAGAGPLQPSAIPCDTAWLNEHLFRLPPKAHKLTKQSFGNYVTFLRQMLRNFGLLDPEFRVGLSEDSLWRPMLDSLKDARCRYGLSKFAAWCDAAGTPPAAVTDETLAAFERHVRARHLRADIPGFIGGVVKSWRKAASVSAAWPTARIAAPVRQQRYRFEMTDFPESLQEQIAQFRRRLSGEGSRGPFRSEGPIKSLRPRSVETRLYGLKLALNAYVETRDLDPLEVTDLAQLLEPEVFQDILTFHWERAVQRRITAGELDPGADPADDAGNTSHTASVASALMIVAKYACRLPDGELDILRDLAAKIRPDPQKMISRRNGAILDRLLEPRNRFALLRLPVKLMHDADAMTDRPLTAALMAMTAVAIEIELNKPLRLMNLTRLRLGEELQFTDPRCLRPTQLRIRGETVKNGVDIEWRISEQLGNLIAHYIRHHRPNLGQADTPWLFPGRRSSDGPRHWDTIRCNIQKAIAEHVGVHVHPHVFRAFVGYLLLEKTSGALEDLRQLLDHTTLETCLKYYAYRNRNEVAGRVDQMLAQDRAGPAIKPPPKSPGPVGKRRRRS